MESFVRYIVILITTLAFVTSNLALSAVHAAKPYHVGVSHSAWDNTAKGTTEHHQHHADQKMAAADPFDIGTSSSKHHSDNSASGCCAFACGGAVISAQAPDLLPLALLSRLPLMLADSVRVADRPPHDRPPRTIEYLAG